KKQNGILSIDLDEQEALLRQEIEQLSTAATEARADHEKIAARVAELKRIDPNDPEHLPVAEFLNNSTISNLRHGYVEAKQDRDALLATGKGERHPDVVKISTKMNELHEAVITEINNVQQSLLTDLDSAAKQANGITSLVSDAKQRALDLNL